MAARKPQGQVFRMVLEKVTANYAVYSNVDGLIVGKVYLPKPADGSKPAPTGTLTFDAGE